MDAVKRLKRTGTFYRRKRKLLESWRAPTPAAASTSAVATAITDNSDKTVRPPTQVIFLKPEPSSEIEEYVLDDLPDVLQERSLEDCLTNRALITKPTHQEIYMLSTKVTSQTRAPATHSLPSSKPISAQPCTPNTSASKESILIQKLTALETQLSRIENQNMKILQTQEQQTEILEEKICSLQTRLDKIDASLAERCGKEPTFSFDPVASIEQLDELETKLDEESFKNNMLHWLDWNVTGERPEIRMSICLDLLISKEVQCKCTWKGLSRGVRLIAIEQRQNLTNLFRVTGSTTQERVNNKDIAVFFMRKLRNAKKRMLWNKSRLNARSTGTLHLPVLSKPYSTDECPNNLLTDSDEDLIDFN